MWKHGVLSAAIVAVIWLGSSLVTTIYLRWLEGSYEKSLQNHLAGIDAADALREDAWRLYAMREAGATKWQPIEEIETRIQCNLRRLRSAVTTRDEERLRTEIEDMIGPDSRGMDPISGQKSTIGPAAPRGRPGIAAFTGPMPNALSVAERASAKADQISKLDHALLAAAAERRLQIGSRVLLGRTLAILVGPILGIVLGWWLSRQLVRTVAQIRVTLTGNGEGSNGDLGTVRISKKDDLAFIQAQVETVLERLRLTASDLQQAREEALRSERLAAVGGLAAGVAHELRNPLTSVKLLLQHAATRPGDAVLPAAKLRLILDEVGRMEGTIQGLLDFSGPPQLRRVRHNLCDTVRRATTLVEGRAAAHGVEIFFDSDAALVEIDGDPQQLHQVFVNLLINGIEAMPEGGSLSIRIDRMRADAKVRVRVEDDGPGIRRDILGRLFEPFVTTKDRGTGLGLAVSRRIVAQHGGSIDAINLPEGGAAFELILETAMPASDAPRKLATLAS